MKKNEIILIVGLLILLLVVILIIKPNKNKKENENVNNDIVVIDEVEEEKYVEILNDGTKLNTSDTLKSDKSIDGLSFTNIQLTNNNGQTVLLADVTNTTDKKADLTLVDVIILDEQGNELGKVGGIVSPLDPSETKQFNTSMTIDYSNAYDFKIVKK